MASRDRRRRIRNDIPTVNHTSFGLLTSILPLTSQITAQGTIISVVPASKEVYDPLIGNETLETIAAMETVNAAFIETNAVIANIKQRIFDIIEAVTIQVSFDEIIIIAKELDDYIDEKYKIVRLLQTIETTLFSIVTNITSRVDFQVILTRIHYLKELIEKIDDLDNTFVRSYENEISIILMDILESITDKFNYDTLQLLITDLQVSIKDQLTMIEAVNSVDLIKTIEQCEPIIISIIENVARKVDLNLVLSRINYLQEILQNAGY